MDRSVLKRKWMLNLGLGLLALSFFAIGCSSDKDLDRVNREQATTIKALNNEVARLNDQLDRMSGTQQQAGRTSTNMQRRMLAVSK